MTKGEKITYANYQGDTALTCVAYPRTGFKKNDNEK